MSSESDAAMPLPIVSVSAAVQSRRLVRREFERAYSGGSGAVPACTCAIHWFTPSA